MDMLDKTAPPKMTLSPEGAAFIHGDEGCSYAAYPDSGGVWTIGWGHTKDVVPGMVCTQDMADQWFAEDVAEFERELNAVLKVPVSQKQFDALVSLTYNSGLKRDLIAAINAGAEQIVITGQWMRWVKDHTGNMLTGLVNRRMAEVRNFFADPWPCA